MVRPIIKDVFFLRQKSAPASKADIAVITDLQDTLRANQDRCVGMAANMIGERKRILVMYLGSQIVTMVNPVITRRSGTPYQSQEGCLCHDGTRPAKRWPNITVRFQDADFSELERTYVGFPAQIIQHEMDHFEGILI